MMDSALPLFAAVERAHIDIMVCVVVWLRVLLVSGYDGSESGRQEHCPVGLPMEI
jgi:hypothetical protein